MNIDIPTGQHGQHGKAKVIIKNTTKLARLRARTGRSLELVSRELNNTGFKCSLASLIRWENGKSMKIDTARALASYYNVPLDEVVG